MRRMFCYGALGLCLIVVLAVFGACGKSPTKPPPFLLRSAQSPCLPGTECSGPESFPMKGVVRFEVVADTVFAYHDTVWYNYGTLIKFEFEQDGRNLDFIEVDTATVFFGCNCRYNLEAAVTGLEKGSYLVRVWTEDRYKLMGEAEIVLTGK